MSRKTNKTAPLLRLISGNDENGIENPIINEEFKEDVIHVRTPNLRDRQTKNSVSENSVKKPAETKIVGINVVSELVQEWLAESIHRFNICECDVCKAEITVEALNRIPPKYIYIDSKTNYDEVRKIKEKCKSEVIMTLVKIAISRKNLPKHMNNDGK